MLQREPETSEATDGLTDVIGELYFDAPTTPADLASIESSCRWCFETWRVRLVRFFLSRNRRRAALVFRAPDAESVRLACRQAAITFDRVWACHDAHGGESQ